MDDIAKRVKKIIVEHIGCRESKVTDDAKLGDDLGIGGVPLHSQMEGFHPEHGEPAVEGTGHGADGLLDEAHLLEDVGSIGDDDAPDELVVAAEVFGGAVEGDVGAELQGTEEYGGGEGGVDPEQQAMLFGQLGHGVQVGDLQ